MPVFRNPNRPWEILNAEKVEKAIEGLSKLQTPHALKTLGVAWGIFLGMLLSLIFTAKLALYLGDLLFLL